MEKKIENRIKEGITKKKKGTEKKYLLPNPDEDWNVVHKNEFEIFITDKVKSKVARERKEEIKGIKKNIKSDS